jgi:catechol 2,3-dioxygenase-like lactoylglutathione lyase family enzyme
MSGFDHLVLATRDLDAQGAFYGRLGFTLTPEARHPWGTANRLAQFQGDFLELLSVAEPSLIRETAGRAFSFGAFNRDFLARRQGMSMLVMRTGNAAADRDRWRSRGLDTWELFDFSRQATLPDGRSVTVAFTLAFVTDPAMPDAAFFVCQQHHPENFWKPQFQTHANGATAIRTVWMVAREPQAHAAFFERLTDPGSVRRDGTALRVAMGSGELLLLDPAGYEALFPARTWPEPEAPPLFAGFAVAADLGRSRTILAANGIPHRDEGTMLRIDPDRAFGCVVALVAD